MTSSRMLQIGVVVVGLLLLLLASLMRPGAEPAPRPPGSVDAVLELSQRDDWNILFILVDTLRADHLSSYGYARPTSPNIDRLAATGIRFARHRAQSSWTKCSMASLWTGLYPARTRVLRSPHALADEATLPAEILREAGFRTAGIWRNGWVAPSFGFGQGFETYTQPRARPLGRAVRRESPNVTLAGSDADLIRSAFSFLRAFGHERWFLYLHMMDVHQYASSEEHAVFGTSYLDIYDNSILWVDSLIGHLLEELETRGLRDNTLIVFAADHGEAFGEHGGEGHARNVHGEVTGTPLILSFPFALEQELVVGSRSENVDLWPTVLDIAGLPPLPDADGRSLVPDIVAASRGDAPVGDETAYAQLDQTWGQDRLAPEPQVAVDREQWRLVYSAQRPERPALYDASSDVLERHDVAEEQPEVTRALTRLAVDMIESRPPPWGDVTPSVEIDESQRDQLRALGYGVQ